MIHAIEVQGLRGLARARLEDLTPVTVLLGPNGSGKSTLLEALQIAGGSSRGDAVGRAVRRRLELSRGARWLFWRGGDRPASIRVDQGDGGSAAVKLKLEPTDSPFLADLVREFDPNVAPGPYSGIRLTEEDSSAKQQQVLVAFSASNAYRFRALSVVGGGLEGGPVVWFVDQRIGGPRSPLHRVYSRARERGLADSAISLVRGIVPELKDIEILTDQDIPVVHFVFVDHSVPAQLAGDGLESLARLALELAGSPGGTVLVEEPEAHQHARAIHQSTRALAEAAKRNIQVVLSTHSMEVLDGLLEAMGQDAEEQLSIFQLRLRNGELLAHRLNGGEARFLRTQIESDLR